MKGYTALDFPLNKKNLDIMNLLDDIVLKYKGRIYLAKDLKYLLKNFIKAKRINKFIHFRVTI